MKTPLPPPRKPETSGGGLGHKGKSHVDAGILPPRETAMIMTAIVIIIVIMTIKML